MECVAVDEFDHHCSQKLITLLEKIISKKIWISPWLLDNEKNPFGYSLFNKWIDLAYALIPWTLLVTAIMDEKIDRSSGIEMLWLDYFIAILYLGEREQYSCSKKMSMSKCHINGQKKIDSDD